MDSGFKKSHKVNPRTTANLLSLITFWWILDIFKLGYKRDLKIEDLYDALDEHRSDFLGDKLEKMWHQEVQQVKIRKKRPSLLRVLIRCFGGMALWLGLSMAISEFMFRMTQPIFLGGLIRYFSPGSEMDRDTAYLYAAGVVVCSTFAVLIENPVWLAALHTGMKMRVGTCSLIYRKSLRLSKTSLREATVGQAVNLLSNDVARLDRAVVFFPFFFIGPVQTALVVSFMWKKIGISAVIGAATVLLLIPLQAGFGKMISTLRLRTARRTDERIRFMNEIIVGIQVIKMYAWEKPFAHLISLVRKHEIKAVRATCFVRGSLLCFTRFGTNVAVFVSIVSYILHNGKITAEEMFMVIAYFNIMKRTMIEFFPLAITDTAEFCVSVKRIQAYLLNDEVAIAEILEIKNGKTVVTSGDSDKHCEGKYSVSDIELMNNFPDSKILCAKTTTVPSVAEATEKAGGDDPAHRKVIRVTSITAKWTDDLSENTLTGVSLDVRPGGLVAIIGPVGSGKTSLLHAILKELPISSGSIMVGGTISYASQEPWLFTGSIRKNILFGQPMNRSWYRQVVRVCALERDFQLLPYGDRTIVGERGITLSGGQRARINLARAVYKDADVYLLDDPLSAVDAQVGHQLFDECVCGLLQRKTRLLVTHQLQYLHAADNIIILNKGAVEAVSTFTQLQGSGHLDFARQLDLELEEGKENNLNMMSVNLPAHCNAQHSVNKWQRQDSESSQVLLINMMMGRGMEAEERGVSLDVMTGIPSFVWDFPFTSMLPWSSGTGSEPQMVAEMQAEGSVSSKVYWKYFSAGGNCIVTLLVFGMCILAQLAISGGDYWMSYWSTVEEERLIVLKATSIPLYNVTEPVMNDPAESQSNNSASSTTTNFTQLASLPSTETCIYVYSGLMISIVVLIICSVMCFFMMCMRASISLHNAMLSGITQATMWFFNNNPSGQILNRFSKDMGAVDEILPFTMMDCIEIGLLLLGIITVVAVVNGWLLIPTAMMFSVFYILRVYFVATSRSIKRLEAIARSPVFAHLSTSLQGLTTIRAVGAQAMLEKEFDDHQDLHSSAWFMFLTTSRAFSVWLDSTCLLYITIVTFSFLVMGEDRYGGDVGLAITQAVGLTGLIQWGIRQSAELENQMTSVERLLEYTTLDKEPSLQSSPGRKLKDGWPSQGAVVFDKVFLTYSKNEPSVLKNITFAVKPAEKVGIVGRTGAGKSSLITALFRLVDLSGGSIQIDGVDIASVGLHDLRSKISIIPQEPVLFSGTLRNNLDPFNQYPDAALWAALAEVEMKQVVDELPAGLSHKVSEGGSNFSVGQRQLLCLARAIIRNNKILVLDEATANVDPQTDELIQEAIHHKFADCTVLTIAHRLHTVMDSDRILIMDAGSVVKFDHPHLLLKNKDDILYEMVQQTGPAMAESLSKMAQISYEKRLEKKTVYGN